ncbi:MAG: DUF3990 domain-containing protein [Butyrivibrio sp.]|nr:DUF3990 domain-containing protein [Butyrivibrio sp.]
MKQIIYHGSDHVIEMPKYGEGATTNDYGRGFYCTKDLELAKEWACGKGTDGYANKYEIDLEGLSILNLNEEPYNILNWLAVLTRHRSYWQRSSISEQAKDYLQEHFYIDISKADVIIGYRADDSYFSFAQDFVSGAIPLSKLKDAMHLGKLGLQIVLKSERAFGAIRYLDNELADAQTYFSLKTDRDRLARQKYRSFKTSTDSLDELYMIDIMRGGIDNEDPRLR